MVNSTRRPNWGGVIALVIAQTDDGFTAADFELGELGKTSPVQALSAGDDIDAKKAEAEHQIQQQLLQERQARGQ